MVGRFLPSLLRYSVSFQSSRWKVIGLLIVLIVLVSTLFKESPSSFLSPSSNKNLGSLKDDSIALDFQLQASFQEPIVFVEVTLQDLKRKESYRKSFLSSGLNVETEFMERGSVSDGFFKLKKTGEFKYNAEVAMIPSSCSLTSSNLKLSLFARVEYSGIQAAMIDLGLTDTLSFLGFTSPNIHKNVTFCSESFKPKEFLSDWFFSSSLSWSNLDYNLNYETFKTSSKSDDVSKCRNENFFIGNKTRIPSGAKVQKRNFVFIGDSQLNFECDLLMRSICSNGKGCGSDELVCTNPGAQCIVRARDVFIHVNLVCVKVRKSITGHNKLYKSELTDFMSTAAQYLENTQDETFLFFNPSGLWEAGRGHIFIDKGAMLVSEIPKIIDILLSTKIDFKRKFFLTTTRVDPFLYKDLPQDKAKITLTQPRVEYGNKLWVKTIINSSFDVIDAGYVSKIGLGESWSPNDMRHLGVKTNWKLMLIQFCHALNDILQ